MNRESIWSSIQQGLQDRLMRRALIAAGLAAVLLFGGLAYYWQHSTAAGESLPAAYGKRRGRGADSVNGTGVLADMFELSGFQVRMADRLSPRLNKDADVIVWFPNDFEPPTKKQREFLERWLADGTRTLIYVGRDYNAAPHYWKAVQGAASPEEAKQMTVLQAEAEAAHASDRGTMPKQEFARWFTVKSGGQKQVVKRLTGPWSQGIDATKTQIPLRGRLDVPVEADAAGKGEPLPAEMKPLLVGDGQPLAFRTTDFGWSDSQLIVVANGAFLLNYPLVNREHRKLAGRLIDECQSGRNVVFLESGPGGPEVLDKEAPTTGGLAMLRIWPLNAIVIHLTVFGIVYCLARWPVFGRPKEIPGENPADFSRHVTALGQLLARTKNLAYAQSRLAHYHQQARRGSGATHGR
jgi:hypothetical protein